jgi:hypothetical protein
LRPCWSLRPVPMHSRHTTHLPSASASADHHVQPAPWHNWQRSFSTICRSDWVISLEHIRPHGDDGASGRHQDRVSTATVLRDRDSTMSAHATIPVVRQNQEHVWRAAGAATSIGLLLQLWFHDEQLAHPQLSRSDGATPYVPDDNLIAFYRIQRRAPIGTCVWIGAMSNTPLVHATYSRLVVVNSETQTQPKLITRRATFPCSVSGDRSSTSSAGTWTMTGPLASITTSTPPLRHPMPCH